MAAFVCALVPVCDRFGTSAEDNRRHRRRRCDRISGNTRTRAVRVISARALGASNGSGGGEITKVVIFNFNYKRARAGHCANKSTRAQARPWVSVQAHHTRTQTEKSVKV